MIHLVAVDPGVVLSLDQQSKIKFWLLEMLPTDRCQVSLGPGVEILVPGRDLADLAPAVRDRIEGILGCQLQEA